MTLQPQHFTGPTKYSIYGGPAKTGPHLRVKGFNTLREVEDFIFQDRKIHPDWSYSVWEAAGWQEIDL